MSLRSKQTIRMSIGLLAAALLLPACELKVDLGEKEGATTGGTVDKRPESGPGSEAQALDTDGNGKVDGVDEDGDGKSDVTVSGECKRAIDEDYDGKPDRVDLNCDGKPDIDWCDDPFVDRNNDKRIDGIDCDCDGDIDLDVCIPVFEDLDKDNYPDRADLDCDGDYEICVPREIDENTDGTADGLDVNCDGKIDERYTQLCEPKVTRDEVLKVSNIDVDCDGKTDISIPCPLGCNIELLDKDMNGKMDGFQLVCESPQPPSPPQRTEDVCEEGGSCQGGG
jgi:hypothetical protein